MTIKIIRALLFLLIFTLKFTFSLCAQQSVLSLGQWIKMSFQEQGVYSIDFNTLSQMGFDAADFNPNQIAIYSYPAGMLPQSNAIDRPTDLDENHIYIEGGEDGSFNSNYLILFYVKSPEKTLYNRATDSCRVIKNHHSESVHYYITLKNNNGLRIQQSPMSITQSPPIDWYREVILHELNEINLLRSGREWLGERFTNNTAQSFQFSANELRRDQSIKFQIKTAAQSFNSSTLNIELNNSNIGQIDFESIPNTQYGIKANLQEQILP